MSKMFISHLLNENDVCVKAHINKGYTSRKTD